MPPKSASSDPTAVVDMHNNRKSARACWGDIHQNSTKTLTLRQTEGGYFFWFWNAMATVHSQPMTTGRERTTMDLTEVKELSGGDSDSVVYKTLLESTKAIPWKIDWATMKFAYIGPQIEFAAVDRQLYAAKKNGRNHIETV